MILRRRGESMYLVYVDDLAVEQAMKHVEQKHKEFVDAVRDLQYKHNMKVILTSKEKANAEAIAKEFGKEEI